MTCLRGRCRSVLRMMFANEFFRWSLAADELLTRGAVHWWLNFANVMLFVGPSKWRSILGRREWSSLMSFWTFEMLLTLTFLHSYTVPRNSYSLAGRSILGSESSDEFLLMVVDERWLGSMSHRCLCAALWLWLVCSQKIGRCWCLVRWLGPPSYRRDESSCVGSELVFSSSILTMLWCEQSYFTNKDVLRKTIKIIF